MSPVPGQRRLEIRQQRLGEPGIGPRRFQIGYDLPLPLHMFLALGNMAPDHVQLSFAGVRYLLQRAASL